MPLFFLVVAVFFIPAQADDLGPYGNYTGTCSLRPVNAQKLQYVTCIPSGNKAFTFDDRLWIGGYVPTDQSIAWDVSLLSSTYQILFQARFQGKKLNVRFNTSPWGSKNVWKEIPPSPTASPFIADQTFYIKIINTPKGIQPWLFFPHQTKTPASNYKYFMITKPAALTVRRIDYYSNLMPFTHSFETLKFTDKLWPVSG